MKYIVGDVVRVRSNLKYGSRHLTKDVISAENFNSVTRPEHYVSGGIECIDAMVAAFGKDATADFCICNAFKYIWRHRKKGNPKQDCEKAIWYLNKYIELKAGEVNDDT